MRLTTGNGERGGDPGVRCAVLVEEHSAFRQAMAYLLAQDLRVELVEEAATLAEARALALEGLGSIDVVVSELSLPDGEATDFLADLREARAGVPVAGAHLPGGQRFQGTCAGAGGGAGDEQGGAHRGDLRGHRGARQPGGSLGPTRPTSAYAGVP